MRDRQVIDILYSGYSFTHENGIYYDTEFEHAGYDCYLLVFALSPFKVLIDGEFRDYPAKTLVLFGPETRKCYATEKGQSYTNDWIHFKTDESFIKKFNLKGVPLSPSDPDYIHELFKLIKWESANNKSKDNEYIKDLFHILIGKIKADATTDDPVPYRQELVKLRRNIMLHPELDWNATDIAEQLKISIGHFHFLYKETFGVPCMEDVIRNRIRLAKDKLLYSTDAVFQISEQCGYKNPEHFCRQFKKITGVTPLKYRSANKNITTDKENNDEEAGL